MVVVCSLRVELTESRNTLSRLNAEHESRRGYQHDKQLENLRALQVSTTGKQCPCSYRQTAGDRGITAENMEKSQHTDFNKNATGESIDEKKRSQKNKKTLKKR